MNGDEASRIIRLINKDVLIFIQTAFGNSNEIAKSPLEGVNDYIEKPCNKTTFDKLIRKHFNKR